LSARALECGDSSPLSVLCRLVGKAEPRSSGLRKFPRAPALDGDKSPAESGDESPHSKGFALSLATSLFREALRQSW